MRAFRLILGSHGAAENNAVDKEEEKTKGQGSNNERPEGDGCGFAPRLLERRTRVFIPCYDRVPPAQHTYYLRLLVSPRPVLVCRRHTRIPTTK